MKGLIEEFKAFILRGNVVDLAVAVIIGAAFGGIVTALTTDIISPLIGMFGGKPDFSKEWDPTINGAHFMFGSFVTVVINFIILAAIIFFLVVKPINYVMSRRKVETAPAPATRDCPYCYSAINIAASRCPFCTSEVPAEETLAEAQVKA